MFKKKKKGELDNWQEVWVVMLQATGFHVPSSSWPLPLAGHWEPRRDKTTPGAEEHNIRVLLQQHTKSWDWMGLFLSGVGELGGFNISCSGEWS